MRKAKTAYRLLEQVAKAIETEPKAYHQGYWGVKKKEVMRRIFAKNGRRAPVTNLCDTVGCRAGWIVRLHDGAARFKQLIDITYDGEGRLDFQAISNRANEILGMSEAETNNLFASSACAYLSVRPGTKAYAKEGARGVREFMYYNKYKLERRLLDGI